MGADGPQLLEIGRVVKPHGLRGEVAVKLVTDRAERLAPGTILHTDGSTLDDATLDDATLEVASSQPYQAGFLVTFAGVSTREAAEALRGVKLLAPPLEDPDALWVHELIGTEVVDVGGLAHGRVVAVEANPASDLLVLDGGGLVPLVFVVDRSPTRVVIDPPAGLFDA